MSEQPYIKIRVVCNNYETLSNRKILERTYLRFKKTHKAEFSWIGTEEDPVLCIYYDSDEDFQRAYRYGVDNFIELVQKLQLMDFPFSKMYGEERNDSPDDEDEEEKCFLILEYETNRAKIMRENYQMTWNVGQIIGTRFYVEETAKGFLIFFDRAVDYEIAQLDRENPKELLEWIKNTPIGKDKLWLEKIQSILYGN